MITFKRQLRAVERKFDHDKRQYVIKRLVEADVELQIDVEDILASLGPRALLSKGGRSVALGGMVKITRLKAK